MKHRHLLGVLAVAGTMFATTGCVATGSDGYYGDTGYGYGYSRPPGETIYIDGRNDDRHYRDRDRERQRWENDRERDRQARDREARERDRDRQARERDRDQRARDEDRRRELERQQRDRDRGRFGSSTGSSQSHADECAAMRRQTASGSDNVITPSRPCR
ncbi:MAG: hypothetical protein RSD57_17075 [Comamonas sp.]